MHWNTSLKAPESHVEAFHRVSSSISANLASEFHMEVFTCVLRISLEILASEVHKASIHNHVLSKTFLLAFLWLICECWHLSFTCKSFTCVLSFSANLCES